MWLRNTIDVAMTQEFGEDYIFAVDGASENHVLGRKIRDRIAMRANGDRWRYPRDIDAAPLADAIDIVCHRKLYNRVFKPFFESAYPSGADELRHFLDRLIAPRNALSHANPISVRQAEQIICYSNDVIDAIKKHMEVVNMGREFNAPSFIRFADSNGTRLEGAELADVASLGFINISEKPEGQLTVGDTLRMEVEVDPSFAPDSYEIKWHFPGLKVVDRGSVCVLEFEDAHVSEQFVMTCSVTSNRTWHRHGIWDDIVKIVYRVFPAEFQ